MHATKMLCTYSTIGQWDYMKHIGATKYLLKNKSLANLESHPFILVDWFFLNGHLFLFSFDIYCDWFFLDGSLVLNGLDVYRDWFFLDGSFILISVSNKLVNTYMYPHVLF